MLDAKVWELGGGRSPNGLVRTSGTNPLNHALFWVEVPQLCCTTVEKTRCFLVEEGTFAQEEKVPSAPPLPPPLGVVAVYERRRSPIVK